MQNIKDIIQEAKGVAVFLHGQKIIFPRESESFRTIFSAWNNMTAGANQMPAFGVSLDELTRQKLSEGLWVEFYFKKGCFCAEMPFDRLLIEVVDTFRGFNLIRHTEGKYQGRCFYLDLAGKDMSSFAEVLHAIAG